MARPAKGSAPAGSAPICANVSSGVRGDFAMATSNAFGKRIRWVRDRHFRRRNTPHHGQSRRARYRLARTRPCRAARGKAVVRRGGDVPFQRESGPVADMSLMPACDPVSDISGVWPKRHGPFAQPANNGSPAAGSSHYDCRNCQLNALRSRSIRLIADLATRPNSGESTDIVN